MGKLIILSGPSCVGKGPLADTLKMYMEKTNKKFKKHVLYNTREKKANEVHSDTYWYSDLWSVQENDWCVDKKYENEEARSKAAESNMIPIMKHAISKTTSTQRCFEIFAVREDLQGLNYAELNNELNSNNIVLLEIYKDKVDDVIAFCNKNGHKVKRIFVAPLSDVDYTAMGCSTAQERKALTESIMEHKLIIRNRDSEESRKERAKTAAEEVEDARNIRDKIKDFVEHFGEDKVSEWEKLQGSVKEDFNYFVNPFGEDQKKKWEDLQKCVGEKPEEYANPFSKLPEKIDKKFREFLEIIFPEEFSNKRKHECKYNMNGCICKICGKPDHDMDWPDNYGRGTGGWVEGKCRKCGQTSSFFD